MAGLSISRRTLLGAVPAVAAIGAPRVISRTPEAQVQAGVAAIAAIIADHFPAGVTRYALAGSFDLATPDAPFLTAMGLRNGWEPNTRLQGGGMWVERSLGDWCTTGGYRMPWVRQ